VDSGNQNIATEAKGRILMNPETEKESAPPSHTTETGKKISCSNCGAPLAFLAGESVLSCSYCGTTTMLAGYDKIVKIESHYVLAANVDESALRGGVLRWMKKGWLKAADLSEKAVFSKLEGVVLPFWVVRSQANTFWSGKNRCTRTVGSGNSRRVETHWEPASGQFSETYPWSVYAREDPSEFWGLDALNPGGKTVSADWGSFFLGMGLGGKKSGKTNLLEGKEPFDLSKTKEMKVANGQITQQRAEEHARNQILTLHTRMAQGKATEITQCSTTVDIQGVDLVYVPLWQIQYQYGGKTYRVLANGHNGEIISAEAPVGKWDKVVVLSIVMALAAGIFGGIAHFEKIPGLWIGTGVCAGIALVHTLWTAFFKKG
jgi:LSD1 subclass zinc finger protein